MGFFSTRLDWVHWSEFLCVCYNTDKRSWGFFKCKKKKQQHRLSVPYIVFSRRTDIEFVKRAHRLLYSIWTFSIPSSFSFEDIKIAHRVFSALWNTFSTDASVFQFFHTHTHTHFHLFLNTSHYSLWTYISRFLYTFIAHMCVSVSHITLDKKAIKSIYPCHYRLLT